MSLILVDPRVAFGRPVVGNSGVRADTIYERWLGGESKRTIAKDYNLVLDEVYLALAFSRWCRRRGRYDAPYAERLIRQHVNAVHRRGGTLEEMRAVPCDWPRVVWPRKARR